MSIRTGARAPGRPTARLTLRPDERRALQQLVFARLTPQAVARRARIVLRCAEGLGNEAVARALKVSDATVSKWRRRYLDGGLDGLFDAARPGRPLRPDRPRLSGLIRRALNRCSRSGGRWSARGFARRHQVPPTTVHRLAAEALGRSARRARGREVRRG